MPGTCCDIASSSLKAHGWAMNGSTQSKLTNQLGKRLNGWLFGWSRGYDGALKFEIRQSNRRCVFVWIFTENSHWKSFSQTNCSPSDCNNRQRATPFSNWVYESFTTFGTNTVLLTVRNRSEQDRWPLTQSGNDFQRSTSLPSNAECSNYGAIKKFWIILNNESLFRSLSPSISITASDLRFMVGVYGCRLLRWLQVTSNCSGFSSDRARSVSRWNVLSSHVKHTPNWCSECTERTPFDFLESLKQNTNLRLASPITLCTSDAALDGAPKKQQNTNHSIYQL